MNADDQHYRSSCCVLALLTLLAHSSFCLLCLFGFPPPLQVRSRDLPVPGVGAGSCRDRDVPPGSTGLVQQRLHHRCAGHDHGVCVFVCVVVLTLEIVVAQVGTTAVPVVVSKRPHHTTAVLLTHLTLPVGGTLSVSS